MSDPTILLLEPKTEADFAWIRALPAAGGLHLVAPSGESAGESAGGSAGESAGGLAPLLAQATAIVTQEKPVTAEMIAAAPNLRLIQRYGSRPLGIDLAAAEGAGVAVATMPLHGCIAVAELAMTLILALSKNLIAAHEATVTGAYRALGVEPILTEQRRHKFQWMKLPGLLEITGRTLGIIGFGEIGAETARRARACGMEVIYNKRSRLPRAIEEAEGVTYAPKEQLLAEADFVLLAAPLTPETQNMIGAAELQLMKPSAYLVNISRGGVIDEAALVEALRARRIAGAGLDVFVYEPIPYDHPLLGCDNVILTPHIGGGTGGARDRQMGDVLANVQRLLRGEAIRHRVV
jgi:phosphoglycerate dehydrogenase-like enzyme